MAVIIPYKSHLGPLPPAKSYFTPSAALKALYKWCDYDCWVVDRLGALYESYRGSPRIIDPSFIDWDDCLF